MDTADPRVTYLAERFMREGYFANELDAHRAARRLVQEVDEMSGEDDDAPTAATDTQ